MVYMMTYKIIISQNLIDSCLEMDSFLLVEL